MNALGGTLPAITGPRGWDSISQIMNTVTEGRSIVTMSDFEDIADTLAEELALRRTWPPESQGWWTVDENGRWWFDKARSAWGRAQGFEVADTPDTFTTGAPRPDVHFSNGMFRGGYRRFLGPNRLRKAARDMERFCVS